MDVEYTWILLQEKIFGNAPRFYWLGRLSSMRLRDEKIVILARYRAGHLFIKHGNLVQDPIINVSFLIIVYLIKIPFELCLVEERL